MDPFNNPFSPRAGAPPPELVGRGSVLEEAVILLGRIRRKRSEKSTLLTSLAPVRSRLIKKGMIYSPTHSELAFTVPLFDEFMIRAMPHLK